MKKQIIMLSLLFVCGSIMSMDCELDLQDSKSQKIASITSLPIELLDIIANYIITRSENLNEAIKEYKKFAKLLIYKRIKLIDKNHELVESKKTDIVDLFSAKFSVPPFVVIEKLKFQLSDESKKNLKEKAIYRILSRYNITANELNAWFEANKVRANKVFIDFISKTESYEEINQTETLAEMAAALIHANADPNLQNKYGDTALMLAAYRDYKDIVKLLLNAGADPNIQDGCGYTALIYAAKKANKDIVELLLNAVANPNVKNNYGNTALIWAAEEGYKDIVELLLNAQADPNIQNKDGDTALISAVYRNHKDIVELLLNAVANPNVKNKYGNTALIRAAEQGYKYIVELLLNARANPNIQNKDGNTALSFTNNSEIKELLKKHGAK